MKRLKESPSGLLFLIGGLIAGFTAGAFLCFTLPVISADAQGVGFFGTGATGARTNCTQITGAVVGQTACFDQAENTWKVYTGASTSAAQWVSATASHTGTNNARDFGMKCDGVTDDTAALQLAINASTPGTVIIPPGPSSCIIASTVTIANGVRILGTGAGPGAVLAAASNTAFRGTTLDHTGPGDLFNVFGVAGAVEAGVGTTFENLLLRQMAGTGVGATGRAIVAYANTDTYKPSWIRIKNVTTETGTGKDDWIWSFYGDGAATTGFATGGIRDTWMENIRFNSGTNGAGEIFCDTCANLFIANAELNGTNSNIQLTGADANHASTGAFFVNVSGNGSMILTRATNVWQAGGSWSGLTSNANTTDVNLNIGKLTNTPASPLPGTRVTVQGIIGTTGRQTIITSAVQAFSSQQTIFNQIAANGNTAVSVDAPGTQFAGYQWMTAGAVNWLNFRPTGSTNLQWQSGSVGNVMDMAQTGAVTMSRSLQIGSPSAGDPGTGWLRVASGVYLNSTQTLWNGFNVNQTPRCTNNCGNTPAVAGNNSSMRVTMGATGTPRSPFLVLFNGTWDATPACIAQLQTATTTTATAVNVTTTGVQVNTIVGPAQGDIYAIHCMGT